MTGVATSWHYAEGREPGQKHGMHRANSLYGKLKRVPAMISSPQPTTEFSGATKTAETFFQHMLVPVDGSKLAEEAIPIAVSLAQKAGEAGKITLLRKQMQAQGIPTAILVIEGGAAQDNALKAHELQEDGEAALISKRHMDARAWAAGCMAVSPGRCSIWRKRPC